MFDRKCLCFIPLLRARRILVPPILVSSSRSSRITVWHSAGNGLTTRGRRFCFGQQINFLRDSGALGGNRSRRVLTFQDTQTPRVSAGAYRREPLIFS